MKNIVSITLMAIVSTTLWAQKPKDTLNTEVIEVVKPYEPTISDSFKIKEQPQNTEEVIEKEVINYQINSVPVASTFTPNKGKPKGVVKPKREKLYDSYISVGFGNYMSPLLDAYVRTYPDREAELGVILNHHSSQGGIKSVKLDDYYFDSKANVYYKKEDRDRVWKLDFGATHGIYNWYGLPDLQTYTVDYLKGIDSKHSYLGIDIGGELDNLDSFFKGGEFSLSSFSDNYKSNEQRIKLEPKLEMPISSERINFQFEVDYLNGAFDRDYINTTAIKYNYLDLGVVPNFEVLRDNLSINLGAKVYYAMDLEKGESELKAYPNVDASFQVIAEVLTIFGGATGGLYHNTYKELTAINPFLSPNFSSVPTDEKYRFYGGMKGKLASNMSYLVSGSYSDVKDKALFILNPSKTDGIIVTQQPYELGNSLAVIYDNAKIINFNGELSLDFSKEFTFGGNVNYNIYKFENEKEPWNLPALKTTVFANYHNNKWTGTAKLFMISDRKDREVPFGIMTFAAEDYIVTSKTLLDLNAEMSYTFTERLSAFAKANNLLSTNYKRYYNYPVQGLQLLAGISYKFDL